MKKKMEERLLLKLPTELREQAQATADKLDRSLSWVIRAALEKYVEENRDD